MFKLKCAMLFASAFLFMLGNISAMQHQDDNSKKPRMPKFEQAFYNSNAQDDDSETIEDDFLNVYNTQSSQTSNEEDSETEEMEIEHITNNYRHLDDDFMFTVSPTLKNANRHRDEYQNMEDELYNLEDLIVSELAITPEHNNPEWNKLVQLFNNGAFNIENFFNDNEQRRITTLVYMRNMTTLYRYMYNRNLLHAFPSIERFFKRWVKKQSKD